MNSKSDIIDELNLIKNGSMPKIKTLNDIVEKNIKNIESVIESKVINIFARPWVKLEPKLKLKKIKEYIETHDNDFSLQQKEKIFKYYLDKKKVIIKYNIEECVIEELKTNF